MFDEKIKEIIDQFQCQHCGDCCRGDGYVSAEENEILEMADFLQISLGKFIEKYTTRSLYGRYWLKEKENRDCIFLEDGLCIIHPVKPKQCRDFPYTWTNPDSMKICPAMSELLKKLSS